jgi:hypothetical protein
MGAKGRDYVLGDRFARCGDLCGARLLGRSRPVDRRLSRTRSRISFRERPASMPGTSSGEPERAAGRTKKACPSRRLSCKHTKPSCRKSALPGPDGRGCWETDKPPTSSSISPPHQRLSSYGLTVLWLVVAKLQVTRTVSRLHGKVERLGFAVQVPSLKLWAVWRDTEPILFVEKESIRV